MENVRLPARSRARRLALAQGTFYLAIGLWPVFDIASFSWLTGARTDFWLARTLGLVLAAIGISLARAGFQEPAGAADSRAHEPSEAISWIGTSVALALAVSDAFYSAQGITPPVFLADAVVEVAFAILWRARAPEIELEAERPLPPEPLSSVYE